MHKIQPHILAVLDQHMFEGSSRPTLRDVLRAFRDSTDGQDAEAIQRQTGMPMEDCVRVANAAGAVLYCEGL
jgi:hypothetical protein